MCWLGYNLPRKLASSYRYYVTIFSVDIRLSGNKIKLFILGLHHTAGVVLRKDVIAENDSRVINLLRGKGAIIIGLTNVPEICMW